MPESLQRMPALATFPSGIIFTNPNLACVERPFLGHLNLRGDATDSAFLDGSQSCLALSLPLKPNTASANDKYAAFWLGPSEWLIVTEPSHEDALFTALRETLSGRFSSVTNITDGQTVIRVTGVRSVDVLRKGCSLDLHPQAFAPGACAQTVIAKAGVLIHCVDNSPTFDLIVRRSFAEYLALWLRDAALEYDAKI